ncbi:MAG: serine/threonine-protein kinase [Myxococcota bacterium]
MSVRVPAAAGVSLDAPADLMQLCTTLTENGFAETYVSGEVTPHDESVRLSLAPPGLEGASGDELEVKGVLGVGGMGRVLLATQHSLSRDVAVKVVRREGSPEAARLLVEEARLTGAVEHPGVVPLYALGSDGRGLPVLVMKRVEGVTWRQLLDAPDHPAWERLTAAGTARLDVHLGILQQVCNAIAFAHRRGVLHRDLKPSNVLVGEFGEVYVADWGVAVRKSEVRPQCLVGTPAYMAPEMVHGDAARLSERTDVFLLGACLFEVLSGRPPWLGKTVQEAVEKAAQGVLPPVPQGVSAELAKVAWRALAANPEERFSSALELRDALARAQRHRASEAITAATQERLTALAGAVAKGADAATVYPLLSECRFGFTQALREWADNTEAKEGRRRALELGARFEVAQGHAAAAKALLHELDTVTEALQADVARLEAQEAAAHARSRRLGEMARELDPAVAKGPRNVVVGGLILALAVFTLARVLSPDAWKEPWALVRGSVIFNAVYWGSLLVTRKRLLTTRINWALAGFFGALLLGQVLIRTLGVYFGLPHAQTLTVELLANAVATGAAALALHWSFGVGAGLLVVSAAVAAVRPDWVQLYYGLLTGAPIILTVWLWRFWRARDVT